MPAHDLAVTREPVANLRTYHRNPRHGDVEVIRASLTVNGQYRPIVVNRGTHTGRGNEVLAGNHTLMAARDAGWADIAVCWVDVDNDQAARIVIADNRTADLGDYDTGILAELLGELPDLDGTGYTADDLTALADDNGNSDGGADADEARRTLAERFGVPPFTILDARQGYWQERKRAWIALGLRSEGGRESGLTGGFEDAASLRFKYGDRAASEGQTGYGNGTSIFDPVLCELLVRWYSAPGQRVLDPFAGGSVRGIVSALLGRHYVGIDLRADQVAANAEQAAIVLHDAAVVPRWVVGDARNTERLVAGDADLMLTCPPYFNLELYSDDPADLSRSADYAAFLDNYRDCLAAATARMAPDAFAAIVTGAIRDKHGNVLDLPADTTRIMAALGWDLYQDAVLATVVASAAMRAASQFTALRKLTRVHQMVSVYHRGNLDRIRVWPPPEVGDTPADDD